MRGKKDFTRVFALLLAFCFVLITAPQPDTVASAAQEAHDFIDYSSIKNKDAVDYLVSLSIIDGYHEGNDVYSYRPGGNLLRGEMAKLIALAVNRAGSAMEVKPTPSFQDISGHWAESYIEYGFDRGYLDGVGGGRFNPRGTVTGVETTKMLLAAIGIANLTGAGWDARAIEYAEKLNLYSGIDADMTKAIDRDTAAQLICNGLQSVVSSDYLKTLTALRMTGDTMYFNPVVKTITRAEFAKALYTMLSGPLEEPAASTAGAGREDLAEHWSRDYVESLIGKGVLFDVGTGFGPDQEITGYEALRALLTALGIDAAAKGLTGADWKGNSVKTALEYWMTALNTAPFANAITWENAARMIYGALDVQSNPLHTVDFRLGYTMEDFGNARDLLKRARYFPHMPTLIPVKMEDGVTLRGMLYMPVLAAGEKVPMLLYATPYRFTDSSLSSSSAVADYFVKNGYAFMALDLRGSGASEGYLEDEYSSREHQDIINVINWSATQPWSNGTCGMIGVSWSGFNSLQVAFKQPEALKAIVTVASTDDRYHDDVHYIGGAVLANEMLDWASYMLLYNARPMDPYLGGDNWESLWQTRIQNSPQPIDTWMSHPNRDQQWIRGSVIEDYSSIKAATLVVGGWNDGYTNGAVRMMDGLTCPKKAIIGPWVHGMPMTSIPGPNIGFMQECVRWYDHWLKGVDNGVMDEPDLRLYLQDAVEPATYYDYWPGKWIGLDLPLTDSTKIEKFFLRDDNKLAASAGNGDVISYYSEDLTIGFGAGDWCPTGGYYDWPVDQSDADSKSLAFIDVPLVKELAILGFPEINLRISSSTESANVIARLVDVAPDGKATLISRGVLDLRNRNGFEKKEPLVPGEFYDVSFRLMACSYVVPAGHTLRLALSTNYWPWLFPSAVFPELKIECGEKSFIDIPFLPADVKVQNVVFETPETGVRLASITDYSGYYGDGDYNAPPVEISPGLYATIADWGGFYSYYPQSDWSGGGSGESNYSIDINDPLSATAEGNYSHRFFRDGMDVLVDTYSKMTVSADSYHVQTKVVITYNGEKYHERTENYTYPR